MAQRSLSPCRLLAEVFCNEAGDMCKRVLVVDDEENIRQMIRLTLETAGYLVGEARSGMEVFAILGGTASWDVILLDQKMPGRS
jgi:CheY-like chemotaxis protein